MNADSPIAPTRRRASMAFILVTLFLDILGIGIIVPVLPQVVTEMLDGDASRAASYYGWIAASYALMQFLFSPLLGALSDRVGRRPVLLVSLFGFGVNYILLGIAPSLGWLFAARVLSGITGASLTTANAYVADISDDSNRAQHFGLVGAMFGLGFIFGPLIGGLLGMIGPRVPFFAAAAVVLVNWFYGLLVLPESLPPEKRRPVALREANPLGGLIRLRRYPTVAGLALASVFFMLAQRGFETIWVLYTRFRFDWRMIENGLSLTLVGLMIAFVQGYLIRRVVRRFGDRPTIIAGLCISIVGMAGYGLAPSGRAMLVVIVFASFGAIAGPTIQGLVAGRVPSSEQGAVQGAMTSIVSLTAILAPLISTSLFRAFTHPDAPLHVPGAPFFAASLFLTASLATVLWVFRRHPLAAPVGAEAS